MTRLRLKVVRVVVVVVVSVAVVLVSMADALAAPRSGNDVGANLGGMLKRYAGEIYGGIVAIVSLMFLVNRRYTDLAVFFLAAVLVAWLVFSPDQVASAARGIGREVLR